MVRFTVSWRLPFRDVRFAAWRGCATSDRLRAAGLKSCWNPGTGACAFSSIADSLQDMTVLRVLICGPGSPCAQRTAFVLGETSAPGLSLGPDRRGGVTDCSPFCRVVQARAMPFRGDRSDRLDPRFWKCVVTASFAVQVERCRGPSVVVCGYPHLNWLSAHEV